MRFSRYTLRIVERRDVAVFLRRQPVEPGLAGMHVNASHARGDDAPRSGRGADLGILIVDAEPAFDGDGNTDRALHGADALGDQLRLRHQAGAEAAGLHPVRRTADVEVDLIVAKSSPIFAAVASSRGSEPPSCSATGCSLASKPSSLARSPWTMAPRGHHLGEKQRTPRQSAGETRGSAGRSSPSWGPQKMSKRFQSLRFPADPITPKFAATIYSQIKHLTSGSITGPF